jgi:hypothetical protein
MTRVGYTMQNGEELFPRVYRIKFDKGYLYLVENPGDFDPAMAGSMSFGYAEETQSVCFGNVHPDEPTKFKDK